MKKVGLRQNGGETIMFKKTKVSKIKFYTNLMTKIQVLNYDEKEAILSKYKW